LHFIHIMRISNLFNELDYDCIVTARRMKPDTITIGIFSAEIDKHEPIYIIMTKREALSLRNSLIKSINNDLCK
jgi:hypothetical protein